MKTPETSIFDIRNNFKRKIYNYTEFRGSRRNGGYYIKKSRNPNDENSQKNNMIFDHEIKVDAKCSF